MLKCSVVEHVFRPDEHVCVCGDAFRTTVVMEIERRDDAKAQIDAAEERLKMARHAVDCAITSLRGAKGK